MAAAIVNSCSRSQSQHLGGLLAGLDEKKQSMWHRLGLRRWLGRENGHNSPPPTPGRDALENAPDNASTGSPNTIRPRTNFTRRLSRKVRVGLPRTTTFNRHISDRRDRLFPVDPGPRRAVSVDRHQSLTSPRTSSSQRIVNPRLSAPEIQWWREEELLEPALEGEPLGTDANSHSVNINNRDDPYAPDERHDARQKEEIAAEDARNRYEEASIRVSSPIEVPDLLEMELEKRWILNLSMHFRDRSDRDKFFVTYIETPNRWRRVTISCDYRSAPPDSLERDLKELRYQRDKNARIYETIRDSLEEICLYDTVTNLKLETRDGRLHVHVTEDVNEIISYPPTTCLGHLFHVRLISEYRLHFDAHISGFVYKVRLDGKEFIKKEIPSPDTVDEFLYEVNALDALTGSSNVIGFEGVVVDDRQEVVKGLLISYAEQGALVDLLYERGGDIEWSRRERWAKQIVQGLCEIHEAGYVQGDFTLSNIVVDSNDHAKIIDINRRGCPVGWEPPEIAAKIESNQRISMYIGVKTDLFQLGMTLWALAKQEDEPERQVRPLILENDTSVPDYYRRVVAICLNSIPRHRLSAKELLSFFPPEPFYEQTSLMQKGLSAPVINIPPEDALHRGSLSEVPDNVHGQEFNRTAYGYIDGRWDFSRPEVQLETVAADVSWDREGLVSADANFFNLRANTTKALDKPAIDELSHDRGSLCRNVRGLNRRQPFSVNEQAKLARPLVRTESFDISIQSPQPSYSPPFSNLSGANLDTHGVPVVRDSQPGQVMNVHVLHVETPPKDFASCANPRRMLSEYSAQRSVTDSGKGYGSLSSSATSCYSDASFTAMVHKRHISTASEKVAYSSLPKLRTSKAELAQNVNSLLLSALPINPALGSSLAWNERNEAGTSFG